MRNGSIQDADYNLRSEKVRSVVGQVPPSLLRYGIIAIGCVLIVVLLVAFFLPYKKVYSGIAIVREVPNILADSIDFPILLRFDNKRPDRNISGQSIHLSSAQVHADGTILKISSLRDTSGRQEAMCRFERSETQEIKYQMLDFQIVCASGNLLMNLFGGFSCESYLRGKEKSE